MILHVLYNKSYLLTEDRVLQKSEELERRELSIIFIQYTIV